MREFREIIDEILLSRGISSPEEKEEFLSDSPKRTYDPFLFDQMEAGVDLLLSEIKKGTRICVYGDYDADGVTSVCIMCRGLDMLTDNYFYYVPDRMDEGYGLNIKAIDRIKASGAGLILTVDCGCVSYKEVEYAKSIGLKVIVTDHHSIDTTIADCIVINPKKKDCGYPFRELAGCGVAFKFVQALQRKADLPKSLLTDVLDMVAIGTIGDIVSLTDENRTLVKYGIKAIQSGRRESLNALERAISLSRISSESIAFGIVPHINAAGRMGTAVDAIKLFTSSDEKEINNQVERLINYNNERKKRQNEAFDGCAGMVDENDKFILISTNQIHEGIAGIVAGKIKDQFNRPVIIATPTEDSMVKGTGRSIPAVDLYDLLNRHQELFVRFGGHKGACGFLMTAENYELLREGLIRDMEEEYAANPDLFETRTEWDGELEPGEVSIELAKALQQLEPFGEGNPAPKFRISNVRLGQVVFMGEDRSHVRFAASDENGSAYCVLFRKAKDYADLLAGDQNVDLIGNLSYQIWRGEERVQFITDTILEH